MTTRAAKRAIQSLLAACCLLLMPSCVLLRAGDAPARWQGPAAGLRERVHIRLDALGVPHISAASEDDAAQAVGFLHGRDRRFQLELLRLTSQGRLTELFGKDLLQVDRRLRLLTFRLDEAVVSLPESDRRRLEAYCRGINQAAHELPRPVELRWLGYRPAPWTVRDVLAIGRLQAWGLSVDASHEAIRARLAGLLEPALVRFLTRASPSLSQPIVDPDPARRPALIPDRPVGRAPGPLVTEAAPREPPRRDTPSMARVVADAASRWLEQPRIGSNAWAVSGARTADGRPLLAGDPHLPMSWPAVLYEAHIKTPEVEVHGATFPGLPMIVIGRAAGVAWSITNAYADTQDLFALRLDPKDPQRYLVDGVAEPFRSWPQTFTFGKKKGQVIHESYRVTRFGPVFNPGREEQLGGATYALAWTGFDPAPLALVTSFDRLYRATTPQDVLAAAESLTIPAQSWVFITRTDHIGYVLGGLLPARRASLFPRDGSTAASAWSGWLPPSERPSVVDPPSGLVVSSNQPILADEGKFNAYACGSYRALRIATRLEQSPRWDAAGFRRLQLETVNLEAARLAPLFLQAGDRLLGRCPQAPGCSLSDSERARIRAMLEQLRGWDFDMRAELPAPLIYASWRGHLYQRLFGRYIKDPELLERYLYELADAPMELALFHPEGAAYWDDPATPLPESREGLMEQALTDTVRELSDRFGGKVAAWSWGQAHRLKLDHPFAKVSLLRSLFGLSSQPAPGGGNTIFALDDLSVVGKYEVETGPALRQVASFAGPSGFVLAGGNAGQPRHRFALNQLTDWWQGGQHEVAGPDSAAVPETKTSGEILLVPAPLPSPR